MQRKVFEWLLAAGLTAGVILLSCCQPEARSQQTATEGQYLVAWNKLFISEEKFDLRQTAVYPKPREEGLTNPAVYGITDRELAFYRCNWCHECGFVKAWDWEHYGSKQWHPRYRGEQWLPVVQRMAQKEDSFLQDEVLLRRIYNYLNKDSLGQYDEGVDRRGAIEVTVPDSAAPASGTKPPPASKPAANPDAPAPTPERRSNDARGSKA